MFKYIEPEVSGGIGKKAILDNSIHPPIVKKLHYEFSGWLENDIIESFPCYIITEKAKKLVEENKFTGIFFDDVIITVTDEFKELYPSKELPKFYWMRVTGEAGDNDFGIANDFRLVISKNVLDVFSNIVNLNNADFEDFK